MGAALFPLSDLISDLLIIKRADLFDQPFLLLMLRFPFCTAPGNEGHLYHFITLYQLFRPMIKWETRIFAGFAGSFYHFTMIFRVGHPFSKITKNIARITTRNTPQTRINTEEYQESAFFCIAT